ncbi:MAG: helix-turn-helix transcriptional regulator [Oscillospiraceae bacterium]|jgi:YesN/AraC family two-component response regulator|nr:helix-turn-helix transcriptional regulator [Oscillospiraceae bacterium]
MTNDQLLDSVGAMAQIALESGIAPDAILAAVQAVCACSANAGYTAVVRKVMERVERDFALKLTLEGLAKDAFVSRTHLCHLFKKETGRTLSSFINEVRVRKSKAFLYNPSLTIADAAKLSGFTNAGYFTKVFRNHEGISPGEFKEELGIGHTR